MSRWSDEEARIAELPIPPERVVELLHRNGFERTLDAVRGQRARHLVLERHELLTLLLALARDAHAGKPRRTSNPSAALLSAVELGYARRRTKTSFRITLAGLAHLSSEVGDWEALL